MMWLLCDEHIVVAVHGSYSDVFAEVIYYEVIVLSKDGGSVF